MVFDRDPQPRIQFASNPLKVVVAQLRFDTDFRLAQPDVLASIQAALKEGYPVVERTQAPQFSVQLAFRAEPGAAVSHPAPISPVRFTDNGGDWTVTIGPDLLSVETTAYESWEEFAGRFGDVLAAVLSVVGLNASQRLGVRFVNELTHPDATTIAGWSRFVDPGLLGAAASPRFEDQVTRAAEQLTLEKADDAMTVRHSYTRNLTGTEPSSIYLLDIDVFTGKPFAIDHDQVFSRLERFHAAAWTLFIESLTSEMIDYLKEGPQ